MVALTRRRHAIEVARHVEHVGDDLEVNVRPPVAVLGRRADRRELLSSSDRLTDGETVERSALQMSVERIERERLVAGDLMPQDDDGSVVEAAGILEPMDHAVEGSIER